MSHGRGDMAVASIMAVRPEPRKAREWWVNVVAEGNTFCYFAFTSETHARQAAHPSNETVLVREVLPEGEV